MTRTSKTTKKKTKRAASTVKPTIRKGAAKKVTKKKVTKKKPAKKPATKAPAKKAASKKTVAKKKPAPKSRKKRTREFRFPALMIKQGGSRELYSFAVDGKEIHEFAAVSRISRDEEAKVQGYQRPEVISHINEIKRYLESEAPMIPNALVVAFDSRVRFVPDKSVKNRNSYARTGTIVIPREEGAEDSDKPGWLVDGQQRAAAIREANIESFPVCVTAFITDNVEDQRSQFILVNSTKPLPKGLIHELLPETHGALPTALRRKKFPAYLLNRLNHDDDSPFKDAIKTTTNGDGKVKDNSILKMIENSLQDGALYYHRDPHTGEGDVDEMLSVLKSFWAAVKDVFGDAWDEKPRHSRLMHGAGIVSLGFLMDAITDRTRGSKRLSVDAYKDDLIPIADICKWTAGYWDFGPGQQRKWNEIQNTTKDIQMLANYLLLEYKNRVWNQGRPSRYN